MAEFNPQFPNTPPDFSNVSRGAEPVRAQTSSKERLAGTLQGVSNLFNAGVKAADDIIGMVIEDKAREGVQSIRDQDLEQTLSPDEMLQSPTIPKEIKSSLERAKTLTTARDNGTVQEIFYWANMDFLARRLRGRYPGHKNLVDSYISGLVGGTPANQLRATLQRALTNEDAGESISKRFEWLEKNKAAALSQTDYFQSRDEPVGVPGSRWASEQEKLDHYTETVGRHEAFDSRIAREKAVHELQKSEGDANDERITRTAQTEIYSGLQRMLDPAITGALGGTTYAQLNSKVQVLLNRLTSEGKLPSVNNLTPAEINDLNNLFVGVRKQGLDYVEQKLLEPAYVNLPEATKQAIRQNAENTISNLTSSITDDKFGLLLQNQRTVQAIETDSELRVLHNPILRAQSALHKHGGDMAVDKFILENHNEIKAANAAVIADLIAGNSLDVQSTTSMNDAIKEGRKITNNTHVYRNSVEFIATQFSRLNELEAPEVNRLVDSTFGPGNFDVLDNFNNTVDSDPAQRKDDRSRHEIYGLLANEFTAKKIFEKDKDVPGIWEKYKNWVATAGTKAFMQDFQNMKEVNIHRSRLSVEWDPVANRLALRRFTPDPGEEISEGGALERGIERNREPGIQAQVDRANIIIGGLVSIMKTDGSDVAQGLKKTFTLMGLTEAGYRPYGQKEGPEMVTLFRAVNNALSSVLSVTGAVGTIKRQIKRGLTPQEFEDTTLVPELPEPEVR